MFRRTRGGAMLASALALALCLLAVSPALAASFDSGDSVDLAAGETIDGNWYVGGNVIRVAGTVDGDLICGATQVFVETGARITGDLMCGAQSVVIDGEVVGDVRIAGFTLRVGPEGRVGGEAIGAGFSIEIAEGGVVEGDVLSAGAQGLMAGEIGGDLKFAGAALEIQGSVAGDVDAEVGGPEDGDLAQGTMWTRWMPAEQQPVMPDRFVKPGLILGEKARIGGDLSYRGPAASELGADSTDAVAGAVDFDPIIVRATPEGEMRETRSPFLTWLLHFLRKFIALAVIGLILAWLAPRLLRSTQAELQVNALPSAGWGCLTLIVSAVGVLTLALGVIFGLVFLNAVSITELIGPLLSGSGLVFALLTAGVSLLGWAGRVAVGDLIGELLLARGEALPNRYVTLLAGLAIFALLASLPIVGGLLDIVGMVLGLGAVMVYLWNLIRQLRGDSEAATALA